MMKTLSKQIICLYFEEKNGIESVRDLEWTW